MLERIIDYHPDKRIKTIQKTLDVAALLSGFSLAYLNGQDTPVNPEEIKYLLSFGPAIVRGIFEGGVEAYYGFHGKFDATTKSRVLGAAAGSSRAGLGFAVGFGETLVGALIGNIIY